MKRKTIRILSPAVFAAVVSLLSSLVAEEPRGARAPGEIASGLFQPSDESLTTYQCPEWFRDAKFGIWSHWGPQAVPREGDWYARKMYEGPGHPDRKTGRPVAKADRDYEYHLKTYGHPSKFGYKDIIPLWKAEKLDPEALMTLYKKTGARYFVSMGTHHDNFFLWDSKIHRWNAVQMGPKKDIVGLYREAASKLGMKFGVSEHLGASFTWFRSAHASDLTGPLQGVPYDGNDPQYQDLYHKPRAAGDTDWLTTNPDDQRTWFHSIKELVDRYQPDLLYSDSPMPFGDVGRSLIAHLYNSSATRNGGRVEAVYTCKEDAQGKWVRDIERGVADGIRPEPWQTDTSIGDWYYRRGQKYMNAGEVVRMLADIVAKNGNLLLNVVQTPEGDLEPDVLAILDGIGSWVALNGEGIYNTRPWQVYGEGPSTTAKPEMGRHGGLKDVPSKPFTPEDFRFTASKDGSVVYAFQFASPTGPVRIVSLGTDAKLAGKPVKSVALLGSAEKLSWTQESGALVIQTPASIPHSAALGYKVGF